MDPADGRLRGAGQTADLTERIFPPVLFQMRQNRHADRKNATMNAVKRCYNYRKEYEFGGKEDGTHILLQSGKRGGDHHKG